MRLINRRFFHRYVIASFICLYLILIQYSRTHFYRDPTSAFFDPTRAYDQIYSRFRTSQARNFIEAIDETTNPVKKSYNEFPNNGSGPAKLCVGIASIAREVNYVESAVGSLLLDLTAQERENIHLIIFIPHTDPSVHPSYSRRWMSVLPDTVLLYDLPEEELNRIKALESADGLSKQKGIFDYAYLLRACHSTGSPYVAIIEDDVIAMDGWYHRTLQALEDAEEQTRQMGASKYLYLRLFYTHKFLGWNKEEQIIYAAYSLIAIASFASVLLTMRRHLPQTDRFLSNETIGILCLVCLPLGIILFFAAGRASMLPIADGVHQMPRFGCCSQAQVFPRDRVLDVAEWYESQDYGYADSLLEEYANYHDEIRWAVTPSVFQHVGSTSSKDDMRGGKRVATSVWNYKFEMNDPIELQREHELAGRVDG